MNGKSTFTASLKRAGGGVDPGGKRYMEVLPEPQAEGKIPV